MKSATMTFILTLLLAWLGSAATCHQNNGRLCTKHERTHPYLSSALTGDVHFPDGPVVMQSTRFTQVTKFQMYANGHSTVASHNGSLYALFMMGGYCNNCGSLCPDNSMYAVKECTIEPHNHYLLGYVGYAKLTDTFGIDGEVRAFPVDFQFDAIEAGHYIPTRASRRHFGIRDMRVLAWDDGVYLASLDQKAEHNFNHTLKHVMTVQRVFPPFELSSTVELRLDGSLEHQWMPIDLIINSVTGKADYLFARSIEPHQIVQCSHDGQCVEAASTSHVAFFLQKFKLMSYESDFDLRIGSNAVRVSEQYYGAILNKEYSNTAHNYAYLFEAAHPWSIVKVGLQPLSFLPRPRCHPYNKWLCTNIVTGLTYVGDKLVISYSESDANPKFYVSSVDAVFADMDNVLDPVVTARPPSTLKVNRFPDEDPDGPVDGWLQHITIPPMTDVTPKVALVCVWNGKTLPAWMDYFVLSASYAADKGWCCCDMCTANVTAD